MEEFAYAATAAIKVNREARQRRDAEPGDLIESVKRLGILNPLIIKRDGTLVAGERRLEAAKALGLAQVPCRFYEDLPEATAKLIELEENIKRRDLFWRDEVRAIVELHNLHATLNAPREWSQAATSEATGLSVAVIARAIRVYRDFDDPLVVNASGVHAAYNILGRRDERASADAISEIIEAGASFFDEPASGADVVSVTPLAKPTAANASDSILHADFTEWVPGYDGPKFNFIHCDFPYGIDHGAAIQAGRGKWQFYDDDEQLYWHLLKCLCENLDRVMEPEGHLMFWFSMKYYRETMKFLAEHAPSLDMNPVPLVWVKSDNVGVLPDSRRGPRGIYEVALFGSREDRLIVKATSNAYSAPTDKRMHPSAKPEPVLRYFFEMFVDASTRMLDPTCGSGTALRAAESLGAKRVFGLEINEDYCISAQSALRSFRTLRTLSK